MKRLSLLLIVPTALLAGAFGVMAQYKAPSQYFRKDFPAPKPGGSGAQPANPATPKAPDKQAPASAQPKFKDLPLNAQFYFQSDTNRSHIWTKVSATTAKNNKSGATAPIQSETPIRK